jgi:hypothetical protein
MDYNPNWTRSEGWVVDSSTDPDINVGDVLVFAGTGAAASDTVTNSNTKAQWSANFPYSVANDRVDSVMHTVKGNVVAHTIRHKPATLTCTGPSGGIVWTAHEGG